MSRTFRKTRLTRFYFEPVIDHRFEYPDEWLDVDERYSYDAYPALPLSYNDAKKKFWRIYSDRGCRRLKWDGYFFSDNKVRVKNKSEIEKWKRNPEYEVFSYDLKYFQYLDYL